MICNFSHLHCPWTKITSQNICSMACWLDYHSHSLELKHSSIPLSAWIMFFKSTLYQARFWSLWEWCQLKCVYWLQQIYSEHAGCCRSGFGLLLPLNSGLPPQWEHNRGFCTKSNESYQSDLLQTLIIQLYSKLNTLEILAVHPAAAWMKLLIKIKYSLHWTKAQHLQAQPVPVAAFPAVHPELCTQPRTLLH